MQFTRRRLIGAAIFATAGVSAARVVGPPESMPPRPVTRVVPPVLATAAEPERHHPLLDEALAAFDRHAHKFLHRDRIGLIDFSRPSSEPRFHLVNLESGRVERSLLVAHGSGSDPNHSGMLQHFSNQFGSNATSRGAYLTADPYLGKYGRSQRLVGLDRDNNMALERAIVLHGAPYVDPSLVAAHGRIGRSQGCFAVQLGEVATVMKLLGEGRMIYAAKPA